MNGDTKHKQSNSKLSHWHYQSSRT